MLKGSGCAPPRGTPPPGYTPPGVRWVLSAPPLPKLAALICWLGEAEGERLYPPPRYTPPGVRWVLAAPPAVLSPARHRRPPPPHPWQGPTPAPAAAGARQTSSVLAPAPSAPGPAARGDCNTRSSLPTCALTPGPSPPSALSPGNAKVCHAGEGGRHPAGQSGSQARGPSPPASSSHRVGRTGWKNSEVALQHSPATDFGPGAVCPQSPRPGETRGELASPRSTSITGELESALKSGILEPVMLH